MKANVTRRAASPDMNDTVLSFDFTRPSTRPSSVHSSIYCLGPRLSIFDRRVHLVHRVVENPHVARRADGCKAVGGGMLERPGDGRGDDLRALVQTPAFRAVAGAVHRGHTLYVVFDARPLVGAIRAEVERGVGHRVSVGGDVPGVLVGAVGPAEGSLGFGNTDVFRDGLGQRKKNSGQGSVLLIGFANQRRDCPPVFGVGHVRERPDVRVISVRLRGVSGEETVRLRDVEDGARSV